ncbi:MAG: SpaA isopeptide-forming pilin-related protein, partial [Oscillospiraceae bacterium]|nr:SpaA isopeptide-forming pilin-related protein [Oscillospiraceae bacterium]
MIARKQYGIQTRSLLKRVVATLLSMILCIAFVPSDLYSYTAKALFGWGDFTRPGLSPDVMTNVKVEFQDSSYIPIDTVESGESFYMFLSLSGNNVYQMWGSTGTTYSIFINDDNLLFPNFAGSGLKDGAKYNGFTMNVITDASGNITSRWLSYTVKNGQTKAVWLQTKFANGTTADNEQATVTVSTMTSFTTKTDTITADASIVWDDSKSASTNMVSLGNDVSYTLKAYPNYSSDKKGEWWVTGVQMTDTITLPADLQFNGTVTAENLGDYITLGSNATVDSVTMNGTNSVTIVWHKDSDNTAAEMAPYTVDATLHTNKLTGTYTSGQIENDLSVSVRGYGESGYPHTLGQKDADVGIAAPTPGSVAISKNTAGTAGVGGVGSQQYSGFLTVGEYVLFQVQATNSGGTAVSDTITLTDVVPAGLTVDTSVAINGHKTDGTVNGNQVTWVKDGLNPGEIFVGYVVCKVDDGVPTTMTNLRNVVYHGTPDDYRSVAAAFVNVKSPSEGFTISKSADKSIYMPGDTITYKITVRNSGESPISGMTVSDTFTDPSKVTLVSSDLPSGGIDLGTGESKDYTVKVKVNNGASGDIINTASASSNGVTQNASVTVYQNAFSFGDGTFSKSESATSVNKTGTVTYYLRYCNNTRYSGSFTADDPLVFADTLPEGLILQKVTIKGTATTNYTYSGGAFSIQYVGDVQANETIEVALTCALDESAGKTIAQNTASVSHGGDTKTDTTDSEITISNISFEVDKWAIADNDIDSIPKEHNPEAFQNSIPSWQTALNDPDVIQQKINDGSFGLVYPGQRVTYYVKITNHGDTLTSFNITDAFGGGHVNKSDSASHLYVIDSDATTTLNGLQFPYTKVDWGISSASATNVSIPAEGYVVLAYSVIVSDTFASGNNTVSITSSSVTETDTIQYNAAAPQLNLEKSVTDEIVKISAELDTNGNFDYDATLEKLKALRFEYNLKIQNQSSAAPMYLNDLTISDILPAGMLMDSASGEANIVCSTESTADLHIAHNSIATVTYEQEGQNVDFAIAVDHMYQPGLYSAASYYLQSVFNSADSNVTITYHTRLSDEKAAEIATMLQNNLAVQDAELVLPYDNTAKVTTTESFLVDGKPTKSATDTATVTLEQTIEKIAPKLEKESLDPAGIINPETYLANTQLWKITVSNSGTADKNLQGFTLTDIFGPTLSYVPKATDGESESLRYNKYSVNGGAWVDLDDSNRLTLSGGKLVMDFSDITLEPNAYIEIQLVTETSDEIMDGKTYYNKVVLDTVDTIYRDHVVGGEYVDGKLEDIADYQFGGVQTSSYKTITYTNNGHSTDSGHSHTDPETATGYGDYGMAELGSESHGNYVQGVQGEQVTYTINLKNDGDRDIHHLTFIDRLPYLKSDPGLISGYDRYSAFTVFLAEEPQYRFLLNGTPVTTDVTVEYSTDTSTLLTEFSEDWVGGTGDLNWQAKGTLASTAVRNIRFTFEEDFKLSPGDKLQIVFNGVVPEYVEKTGEENIAWNSFAYAYKYNRGEFVVDTPMVAEPAKVGVWVPTKSQTASLTINKGYTSGQGDSNTFWFALFTEEAGGVPKIYGAPKKITVKDGETATLNFEGIEYGSVAAENKKLMIYETDAVGNILTTDTSDYVMEFSEVSYDTEADPVMPTDATAVNNGAELQFNDSQTAAEIAVLNKITYGSVQVNKTFVSPFGTTDTFYFGVFSKDEGGLFHLYGEVQSVTLTGTATGATDSVTFNQVPTSGEWYVLETDALGNPLDDRYTYTVTYGENAGPDQVITVDTDTPVVASVENNESAEYLLTVRKTVSGTVVASEFKIGLFTKNGEHYELVDTKTVQAGSSIVFTGLSAGIDYYVFEVDSADKPIMNGTNVDDDYIVEYNNYSQDYDDADQPYDVYNPITFIDEPTSTEDTQAETSILNREVVKNINGEITVTKKVTVDGEVSKNWDDTFYVGVFTLQGDVLELYGSIADYVKPVTKDNPTVTFVDLPAKTDATPELGAYYILECTDAGVPFETGANGAYTIYYSVDGSETVDPFAGVTLDGTRNKEPKAEVAVDNRSSTVNYAFSKITESDAMLAGAELAIYTLPDYQVKNDKGEPSGSPIMTWTSSADVTEPLKSGYQFIAGVTYVLVEQSAPSGYKLAQPILFTIDEKGAFYPVNEQGGFVDDVKTTFIDSTDVPKTAILYMYNEAVPTYPVVLSKQAINGTTELPGASLAIYDAAEYEAANGLTETLTPVVPAWVSDVTSHSVMLSAGTYVMVESIAPKYYALAESIKFRVADDGMVYLVDENDTETLAEDATVTMKDALVELAISKQDIADGSKELPGATMVLSSETVQLTADMVMGYTADENSDLIAGEYSITDGVLTWVTGDTPLTLVKLPDGDYTLEETVAPDGYTVISKFTFTVEDGKVTSEGNAEVTVSDSGAIITALDAASVISIGKYDITGENEVAGATISIVAANPDTDLSKVEIENATKLDTANNEISWVSTDQEVHIKGLPDGQYTLKESGDTFIYGDKIYNVIESTVTFSILNGVIVSALGDDLSDQVDAERKTGYYLKPDNTTFKVCDAEAHYISISKQDIANEGPELAGAEMKLTWLNTESDATLENIATTGGETVTKNGKVISWTSSDEALVLKDLPDGDYTLEETAAPDGYTVISKFTFTVEDGKVTSEGNAEVTVSDNGLLLTVLNAAEVTTDTTTTETTSETTTTTTTSETTTTETTSETTTTTTSETTTTETTSETTTTTTSETTTTETTSETTTTTTSETTTTETTSETTTTTTSET